MDNEVSTYFSKNSYQAPVVYVEIMGVTFGLHDITDDQLDITTIMQRPVTPNSLVKYPNLVTNLKVDKIVSGEINKYTLEIKYLPQDGEDPSYIDKLLSANRTQNNSMITIAYGDGSLDGFNFRKYEAMVVGYKMKVDFSTACMTYTINAMSIASSYEITGPNGNIMQHSFVDRTNVRVSDIIKEIYYDPTYGLQLVFPGGIYIDGAHINEWDPKNPPDILLEESTISGGKMTPFQYLKSLVPRMIASDIGIEESTGFLYSIDDGYRNQSFHIDRVLDSNGKTYADEIVIGTEGSVVIDYEVTTDMSLGIAIDYGKNKDPNAFTSYFVNSENEEVELDTYGSIKTDSTDDALVDKKWWDMVSSIPYGLRLVVRAMKRQIPLMTPIKVTILIKGRLYFLSGIYMVVKVNDEVNGNGYTTEMELLRTSGLEYIG